MKQSNIDAYKAMYAQYHELFKWVAGVRSDVSEPAETGTDELEELIDAGYCLNEASKLLESSTKLVKGALSAIAEKACVLYVTSMPDDTSVRTEYTTATPKTKMVPIVPSMKKDPEAYEALMVELGVPTELWTMDVVRPHYPGLVEYHNSVVNEGKPEFLEESTYVKFSIIYRKRKGLENE